MVRKASTGSWEIVGPPPPVGPDAEAVLPSGSARLPSDARAVVGDLPPADVTSDAGTAPLSPVATRPPGSSAGLADAVAGRLNEHMDGFEALFGPDPFGIRRLAAAPRFLAGFDYSALPPNRTAAFLNAIDLVRPRAPEPADLRPEALDAATVSGSGVSGSGAGTHQVPHLSLSIWLGGPLHDDGAARQEFMTNVAAGRAATDFEYVVLTDVTRAQFDAVRDVSESELDDKSRPVRAMLTWAEENRIRLVNVDEVFNAEHPSDLLAAAHVERARGNGNGYAAASDILRSLFLSRFGGVYSDGDNKVRKDANLADAATAAADSSVGLAFGTERHGHINNSVIAAAAGSAGIQAYVEVLRENQAMTYSALAMRARATPDLDLTSLDADDHLRLNRANVLESPGDQISGVPTVPRSETTTAEETILRTGPNRVTFDRVARRLNMQGRAELPRVPDSVYVIESSQSWITPPRADSPSVDTRTLATTVIGAVTALHRETRSRSGGVYLPSAARTIDRLPASQQQAAWEATLRSFKDTLAPGTEIQWVAATNLKVPSALRPLVEELFPDTELTGFTSAASETTAAPASAGAAASGAAHTVSFGKESKTLSTDQEDKVAHYVDDLIRRALPARAVGTPLPQLMITGYGRGQWAGLFGQNQQARDTGQQRADVVRRAVLKHLQQRLNGDPSARVRAEDFVITIDSRGTKSPPQSTDTRWARIVENPGVTHTVIGALSPRAPVVPKSLHFVHLGNREIGPRTEANLRAWAAKARSARYTMHLWVDEGARRANAGLLKEFAELITVSDIGEFASSSWHTGDVSAELGLALRHGVHGIASDLARYAILQGRSGGIYVDAGVAPGSVRLPRAGHRLDPDGIPFLASATPDAARLAELGQTLGREATTAAVADRQYGSGRFDNRFIIAPPGSTFLNSLLERIKAPRDGGSLLHRLQAIEAAGSSAGPLIDALAAETLALTGATMLRNEIESRIRAAAGPEAAVDQEFRSGRALVDPTLRAQWDGLASVAGDVAAPQDAGPRSPRPAVTTEGDVLAPPAKAEFLSVDLAELLEHAPVDERRHTWLDPASTRPVRSAFDVRRVEHGGTRVTEVTVKLRLNLMDGVDEDQKNDTVRRLNAGVHEFFNERKHRFTHGELRGDQFHVTVVPVGPGENAHLNVNLMPYVPGRQMDQRNWVVGQAPIFYAHEIGHQLGGRDESGTTERTHELKRVNIKIERTAANAGGLLGDFDAPAEFPLSQGGLRPRNLDLFATLIGDIAPYSGQKTSSPAVRSEPARARGTRPARAFLDSAPRPDAVIDARRAEPTVTSTDEAILDGADLPAAASADLPAPEPVLTQETTQETTLEPAQESVGETGDAPDEPVRRHVPQGLGWGVARWAWSWGMHLDAVVPGSLYDAVLVAGGGSLSVGTQVLRGADELRGFLADRMLSAPPTGELWSDLSEAYSAGEEMPVEPQIDSGRALTEMVAAVRRPEYRPELDQLIAPMVVGEYLGRGLLVLGDNGRMRAVGSGQPMVVAEAAGLQGGRQWLGFRPTADGPPLGGVSAAQAVWSADAGMAFTGRPRGGDFFDALAAAGRRAGPEAWSGDATALRADLVERMHADPQLTASPGWELISAAFEQATDRPLNDEAWQQVITAVAGTGRGGALDDTVLHRLLPVLTHHYLNIPVQVVRADGEVDAHGRGPGGTVALLSPGGGDTGTARPDTWLGLVPVAPARLLGAGTRPMDVAGGWSRSDPAKVSGDAAGPVAVAAAVTPAGVVSASISAAQLDWVTRHHRQVVLPAAGDRGFLPALLAAVGGRHTSGSVTIDDVSDLRRVLVDKLFHVALSDPYLNRRLPSSPVPTAHEDDPEFSAWRASVVYTIYKTLYRDARMAEWGVGAEGQLGREDSLSLDLDVDQRIDDGRAFNDIITSVEQPDFWPELAEHVVPYFLDELGLAVRVVDAVGQVHRYGAGRTAYVAPAVDGRPVSWAALPPAATRYPAGPPLGNPNQSDPVLVRLGQAADARRAALTAAGTPAGPAEPVMEWLRWLRERWLAQTEPGMVGASPIPRSSEWLKTAVTGLTRGTRHTGGPDEVAAGLSLGSAVELAGILFPPARGGIRSAPSARAGGDRTPAQAVPPSGVAAAQWVVAPSLRELTGVVPAQGAALFLQGERTWVVVDTTDGRRLVEFDPAMRATRPVGEVSPPPIDSDPREDEPGLALVIDPSGQVLPADELHGTLAPATGWDGDPPFGAVVPGLRDGSGQARFTAAQETWADEHSAELVPVRPGDDAFFDAVIAHGPLRVGDTDVTTATKLRQALAEYLRTRLAEPGDSRTASLLGSVFRFNAEQRDLEDKDYDQTRLHRDALHHRMGDHLESGRAVDYVATAIETPGHWEQVTQHLVPHLLAESTGARLLVLEPDGRIRGYGEPSGRPIVLARAQTGMAAPRWASVRGQESEAEPFRELAADVALTLPIAEHVTEPGSERAALTGEQQRFADARGLEVQPTRQGHDSVYSALLAAAGGVLHLDTETVVHDAEGLRRGLAGLLRVRPDVLDADAWKSIAAIPGYEGGDLEQVIDALTASEAVVHGDQLALGLAVPYLGVKLTVVHSDGRETTTGAGRQVVVAAPGEQRTGAHWAALTPAPDPNRYSTGLDSPGSSAFDLPRTNRRKPADYEIVKRGATRPDGWREPSYCTKILIAGKWQDACVSVAVVDRPVRRFRRQGSPSSPPERIRRAFGDRSAS
jgi:hypothetical protein